MKFTKYVLYDGQPIAGLSYPKTVHMKYTKYVLFDGQLASLYPTYKLSKIGFQCKLKGQCSGKKRANS